MGLLNYAKPGKGVKKEDLEKTGLALYFDIFRRRIWKLMTLNMIYVVVSIPAILITWTIASYLVTYLASLSRSDVVENANIVTLIGVFTAAILFQFFGSGPATASLSFILRKYIKDSHVWVFSDFFEHLKKNFKQGLAVYVINTVVSVALIVAYIFYALIWRTTIGTILSLVIVIVSAFFIMMQMYTYQLLAGFEFKLKDIYKNSLLLTMLKLPWNILIMLTVFLIMYTMYSVAMTSPFAGIILFVVIYMVLVYFTQLFMTNNIIKEYVLEPSLEKDKKEN